MRKILAGILVGAGMALAASAAFADDHAGGSGETPAPQVTTSNHAAMIGPGAAAAVVPAAPVDHDRQ